MIMSVTPWAGDGVGPWTAECTICGWRRIHPNRWRARHAAAQHLWAQRGRPHERRIGKPRLCPTPTKIRHPTRQDAVAHITRLYRSGRGNPDYQPYQCVCGAWHVGHSVVSFRRRIKKAIRR